MAGALQVLAIQASYTSRTSGRANLENLIHGVETRVLDALASDAAWHCRSHNTCGLVMLARKLIRIVPYHFIPTDKDGGFAAVHTDDLHDLRQAAMHSAHYRKAPLTLDFLDGWKETYRHVCGRVTAALPKVQGQVLFGILMRDVNKVGIERMFSGLRFTL